MALLPGSTGASESTGVVLGREAMVCCLKLLSTVCMSFFRRMSCMPSQKEPKAIQGVPSSSITTAGSMALKRSFFTLSTTRPVSVQSPFLSEVAWAWPMTLVFLPKAEPL